MVARVTPPTAARATGLSRRAALRLSALAPMALALTACSASEGRDRLDDAVDELEAPRRTPPAPANPDQSGVDAVIVSISELASALRPLRTSDAAFADLLALHEAQLKRLGPASAPFVPAAVPLDGSRAQVREHEAALSAVLAHRAGSVHDGELARLLASMSAAVAQRVAVMAA